MNIFACWVSYVIKCYVIVFRMKNFAEPPAKQLKIKEEEEDDDDEEEIKNSDESPTKREN